MAKSVTAQELRDQSVEDLVAKLKEAKTELFNLRFQAATGQLDNHSRCVPSSERSRGSTRSSGSTSWASSRCLVSRLRRRRKQPNE